MATQLWTDQQFDEMSWHDNYVHGFEVIEGQHGTGQLVLDIDYITEWLCAGPEYRFRITPARLVFREVFALRMSLDYATPAAAFGPFAIDSIERREEQRERYVAKIWTIKLNWPSGSIEFEATGFEQRAVGGSVLSEAQCLRPEQRDQRP